jgi:hypothetical protein
MDTADARGRQAVEDVPEERTVADPQERLGGVRPGGEAEPVSRREHHRFTHDRFREADAHDAIEHG